MRERLRLLLKDLMHGQIRRKGGKTFVNPRVETLVGGKNTMEPAMDQFVHHNPYQTSQGPFSGNQRGHGILHSPVTALYDRKLFVRILTEPFVQEFHGFGRV